MKTELGVFFTCFKEKKSVEYAIDELFKIYKDIPVYLVSDGGEDYSYLESKYNSLKTNLCEDSRGFVPKISESTYKEEKWQQLIKKSILIFIDRIAKAINYCNSEYILIMEPDVLVRGKLNIQRNAKINGSRVNTGLSKELKNILANVQGAKIIDCWGATPTILESETFLKAIENIKANDKILNDLCFSDHRLANYDIFLPVLLALLGYEEVFNPDITECFRNPNWQISHHPLLHQFRAYYPKHHENYEGRHSHDQWLW